MTTVDAVFDRLRSTGLRVHDGHPTSPRYPYVVVFFDSAPRSSNRAADVRVQATRSWQTTTVGESAAQCRAAAERVVDVLTDWAPDVPGRVHHKVDHLSSQTVGRDDELLDRAVFYGTDQWSVVSSPVAG